MAAADPALRRPPAVAAAGEADRRPRTQSPRQAGDRCACVESVDQDGLPENAHAVTLHGRLSAESGEAWGFKLLEEVDLVSPLDDDDNDTLTAGRIPGRLRSQAEDQKALSSALRRSPRRPGPGPSAYHYNDERFVGNVGWRQDETDLDALHIADKSLRRSTLDLANLNRG